MNPVNATALYVSASRSVLQCDPRDPRAMAELCRLLPFFRQSLSCLVCGNVLQDPIAPTNSSCQHYVCRGCKGRRMQLKPSCSWCKDYSCFQENRQLSLLVHCYRKLCLYITQSPLAPHIAGAAHDSPDLQAILSEGLTMADGELETDDAPDPLSPEEAPPTTELKEEEPCPVGVNGLHGCNGSVGSDTLHPVAMETGGGVVKQEEVPVCVSVTTHREVGLCDISLKHGGGGPLLLSVEEVLRTLESDPDCLNGRHSPTRPDSPRPHALENKPCSLQPRPPPRCRRKRSHSESDSEKLQPLPISSLLPAPPCSLLARVTPKLEPRYPHATPPHPHPHLAPLPNGGPSKPRPLLVPNKALKKTSDHHGAAKKAFPKARQGAAKPRPQHRDRLPPHTHPLTHPPSPSKPLHKKPVEKKGCKCGRATQNPSVLTCRGQRCPCYSNRKACLDCICRGCQNSYMANGEKKLEAFAVPEKALEQTRLTLGINLTSIAAAALRNPATSVSVTTATGTPVTASAYLSGAGHDGRGFDDSLEVRFDC